MNRSEAFQRYVYNTGKASEITRQIALVGVALVWLFRETTPTGSRLPPSLKWAATIFVLVLALDLFQYVIQGVKWHEFALRTEKVLKKEAESLPKAEQVRHIEDQQFDAPDDINRAALISYYGKLFFVVVGYVLLFTHLWGKT